MEGVVKAIAEYTNTPYTPPGVIEDTKTYTVQRGDTLYKIANQFNITVAELMRINNLTSDNLSIGQVLYITPQVTEPTMIYTVQRGDTLYAIANRFNTTVDNLKRLNKLTSNTLFIGQELLVPSSTIELPDDDIEIPDFDDIPDIDIPEDDEEYTIYEVVKGDSLWAIAKRYGITVDELIALNNLSSIELKIGDQLKVPNNQLESTYTVKIGDTLWSIARENNISVEALKNANNLTSNLLSVGQVLIIPN